MRKPGVFDGAEPTPPEAPGRTPHRSALRLPGAETLLVPGASPRTPMPHKASEAPAREADK